MALCSFGKRVSVAVIEEPAALEALVPEWQMLWERCPEALPFTAPAWLTPWWRTFAPGPLFVLAARKEGRLVALAPGYIERERSGRRILPLGISVSDHLDVLADPECAQEGLAGLALAAQSRRGDWDRWELEELPPDALAHRIPLPPGYAEAREQQQSCPTLFIPEGACDLAAILPRRKRQQLQLARNRCQRRGAVQIERISGPDLLPALDELIGLHGLRWRMRGEAGVLAAAQVQAFHRRALPMLEEAGLVRMYRLVLGSRIAAVYYGFSHRCCASFYLAGFDPEFAFESPGTVVIAQAIQDALAEGCRAFDFLRGAEAYKYSWGAVDSWNWKRTIQTIGSNNPNFD